MWLILFTLRNTNLEVHGEEHICKRVSSSMSCGGKSKESKPPKRLENKLEWGRSRAGKSACCCAPRLFGVRTQLNLLESTVPLNFFDVLNRHALQGDAPVLAYRHQFHWQGSLPHCTEEIMTDLHICSIISYQTLHFRHSHNLFCWNVQFKQSPQSHTLSWVQYSGDDKYLRWRVEAE